MKEHAKRLKKAEGKANFESVLEDFTNKKKDVESEVQEEQ